MMSGTAHSNGKKDKEEKLHRILGILVVCAIAVFAVAAVLERIELPEWPKKEATEQQAEIESAAPDDSVGTEVPAEPVEPEPILPPAEEEEPEPVVRQSTATVGAVGDVLLHDDCIAAGRFAGQEGYDFSHYYTWFGKYIEACDYAAANLEVTLASDAKGYRYSGYPCFNAPDEIVDALKGAGFDLLLTANNHRYDTGDVGFLRTQEVIADRELDWVGTRLTEEEPGYIIREIEGIKVGMINYTYANGIYSGLYIINNTCLSAKTSPLLNAFTYGNLSGFYEKLSGEMERMKEDGAEVIVLFIHWGTEYVTTPGETQKKMAQALCDLGVDVIVGNHPHVVQPVELLTASEDETQKTLCLYSTGNSVSNFFETATFSAHTEDGMLFTFDLVRYSDGTVLVEKAEILPTWVYRPLDEGGVRRFYVLPLDPEVEDWKDAMELDEETLLRCEASYDRTMTIVGESLAAANEGLAQHQAAVEAALGVVSAES